MQASPDCYKRSRIASMCEGFKRIYGYNGVFGGRYKHDSDRIFGRCQCGYWASTLGFYRAARGSGIECIGQVEGGKWCPNCGKDEKITWFQIKKFKAKWWQPRSWFNRTYITANTLYPNGGWSTQSLPRELWGKI